jgi:hypothetical protein
MQLTFDTSTLTYEERQRLVDLLFADSTAHPYNLGYEAGRLTALDDYVDQKLDREFLGHWLESAPPIPEVTIDDLVSEARLGPVTHLVRGEPDEHGYVRYRVNVGDDPKDSALASEDGGA